MTDCNEPTLLPCPFCDGEAELRPKNSYWCSGNLIEPKPYCMACGATVPKQMLISDPTPIEAWNRRAASPAAPGAEVEPVALGPRPCDCERCDCGNVGDAKEVAAWDERAALARTTDAIRAQAWREGVLAAVAWVQERLDDYVSECGIYDPSTGVTEFSDAGEYAGELEEIVDGLKTIAGKPGEAV